MISKNQFNNANKLFESGVYDRAIVRQAAGLTAEELEDLIDNYQMYKEQYEIPEDEDTKSAKQNWFSNLRSKITKQK